MTPDSQQLEAASPEGWEVAEEVDQGLSVAHRERDVAVTLRRREVSTPPAPSWTDDCPSRSVFEVVYRPPSVDGRSIHLGTETCPDRAERLLLEVVREVDDDGW